MTETMPQLDASTFSSQIFWLLVCFSVLCFAIATFLAPRIAKSLAVRQQELDNLKIKAEKILDETNKLKLINQKNFETAKHDASMKMHLITQELNRTQDNHMSELERKSQDILSKIQQSLNEQKRNIVLEMGGLLSHLSSEVFQSITKRPVNESKINQSVHVVQQNSHNNGAQ